MGVVEVAGVMLSRAMQRVELSAQNLANLTTPGFKAYRSFASAQENASASAQKDGPAELDFSAGKLQQTGNPLDLAIAGNGFFVVHSQDGTFYTRNGQFQRDAEGRLSTPEGLAVESDSGEINLEGTNLRILADGTVLEQSGEPAGRIRLVDFEDRTALQPVGGGLFRAPANAAQEAHEAQIRQGMLESSNVSTADEMLSIMAALRNAECGQKFIQTYDDLMGRVITTFGQT